MLGQTPGGALFSLMTKARYEAPDFLCWRLNKNTC